MDPLYSWSMYYRLYPCIFRSRWIPCIPGACMLGCIPVYLGLDPLYSWSMYYRLYPCISRSRWIPCIPGACIIGFIPVYLGLDGSLVFLEHVFWVVSLNSLFILVFAFCPYHIGHFTVSGFKIKHIIKGVSFEVNRSKTPPPPPLFGV